MKKKLILLSLSGLLATGVVYATASCNTKSKSEYVLIKNDKNTRIKGSEIVGYERDAIDCSNYSEPEACNDRGVLLVKNHGRIYISRQQLASGGFDVEIADGREYYKKGREDK